VVHVVVEAAAMKLPLWLSILISFIAIGIMLWRNWHNKNKNDLDWLLAVVLAGLLLGDAFDAWLKH
jgi:uncharacterized membrane protein YhhN